MAISRNVRALNCININHISYDKKNEEGHKHEIPDISKNILSLVFVSLLIIVAKLGDDLPNN